MTETPPPKTRGKLVLGLFLLIWAAFVGAWLYIDQDPTELWVVNGLTIPVTVEVDGEAIELAAAGYDSIVTGRGDFDIVVRSDDGELASETITIPKGRDVALYNVLGAAWVTSETVWYTQYGASGGDRNWAVYAVDTFHDIEDETVHYAFRETPNSVTISSSSNRATVRWLGVGQHWTWRHTLSTARAQGLAGVDALEQRLRQAMPTEFATQPNAAPSGGAPSPGGGKP